MVANSPPTANASPPVPLELLPPLDHVSSAIPTVLPAPDLHSINAAHAHLIARCLPTAVVSQLAAKTNTLTRHRHHARHATTLAQAALVLGKTTASRARAPLKCSEVVLALQPIAMARLM